MDFDAVYLLAEVCHRAAEDGGCVFVDVADVKGNVAILLDCRKTVKITHSSPRGSKFYTLTDADGVMFMGIRNYF